MTTLRDALHIAWKLHQARDYRGAEAIYQRVLQADPANADAWCFMGILHFDEQRFEQSVEAYHRALEHRPNFPIALSNLGNSLSALAKLDEAAASVRRALQLQPDYTTAWTNLGAIQVKQGELAASIESFERAVRLAPQNEAAHRNLGAVMIRQGRFEEGSRYSEAALRLDPSSPDAHRNRAIVWLMMGDYERGWDEYEWRWGCADNRMPNYPQPLWQGEPLQGRTLLLHAEQGLGDTIHFIRYAKLARQRGARVVVECQAPLVPLLSSYEHADQLVPRGQPLPPFDVHLPLMSAPRVLKTRVENIPAEPSYLRADPQLVAAWQERLSGVGPLRVGLAWQGSTDHQADRQRSMPLRALLPLAVDGVKFVSLQVGTGREQIAEVEDRFPLVDFGSELDREHGAFMDTAAIMLNLDLVITIDSAIAHVAGALGVPVWTLLPFSPDWRWMLGREDTQWYPSMRLLRQPAAGDWASVVQNAAARLLQLAREKIRAGTTAALLGPKPAPPSSQAGRTADADEAPVLPWGEVRDYVARCKAACMAGFEVEDGQRKTRIKTLERALQQDANELLAELGRQLDEVHQRLAQLRQNCESTAADSSNRSEAACALNELLQLLRKRDWLVEQMNTASKDLNDRRNKGNPRP